MIKIGICDDEEETRKYLLALIKEQNYPCEIVEYVCAGEFLLDDRDVELLFLDIEFPSDCINGMEMAREYRERSGIRPVIIFVTGYDQYVFEAFDVGAFHYLLKPLDEEKFARVFARAVEQINTQKELPQAPRALTLQFANTCKMVPLRNICYIESSDHKVILHLRDGELAYYAKLRDLEEELQEQFYRVHKGYLVNLAHVESYTRTELTLANGVQLLISKYRYQEFVKAYLRFLRRGEA